MATPTIPEYVVVHLGAPNEDARNITVPFLDYIKNVASSEIYPTWPENSLRANILAIITFTLNRIYTEWYKSKGYDFDITNTTRYDQKFIENRETFDTIDNIVDEIFNDYVVKEGKVNPYFTQYCDGVNTKCTGLSQWGTVDLAEQGLLPYEILRYYYGNDTDIVFDAPVAEPQPSYPGVPLRLGSSGEEVRVLQRELNRISENYGSIPLIKQTNGFFGKDTDEAVREFQSIFDLAVDGVVNKATWYKIRNVYNGVKNLAELYSEGLSLEEVTPKFPSELKLGDKGTYVRVVQYYLSLIGYFDENIPILNDFGVYDVPTKEAVEAFQKEYELPVTGIVNRDTWNRIQQIYNLVLTNLPSSYISVSELIFPGRYLSLGMEGDDVVSLQKLLKVAASKDPDIPDVSITGVFDQPTYDAVSVIERKYDLPEPEIVGPLTWNKLMEIYKE